MIARKKPEVLEFVRWTGNNIQEVLSFIGYSTYNKDSGLRIETLEGVMPTIIGDYIVKDVKNEFYAYKPDVFKQKYDLLLFEHKCPFCKCTDENFHPIETSDDEYVLYECSKCGKNTTVNFKNKTIEI